jgi:CubicO group peptidase (beta-lactamase class C family)
MFRRGVFGALITVIVLAAFPATAQQRVWTETGEPVSGWEFVDDGVRDWMETWAVPGAALSVAVQGQLVFSRGYTWDTADAEVVQPDALFRIASASKPITSVAIHQLIERGLLSYDTRVVDVLDLRPRPGLTADPRLADVTVDHLLYHTGGWDRDQTFDPMFIDNLIAASLGVDLPISKDDIATFMTGRPMQFDPGARYVYSNYGYCLLGMIIEEITGRDYSEWVAENVFQPIGVGRPRRGHTAIHERAPGEVRYHGVPGDNDQYVMNVENMDAHGGWIVAAPDYVRFLSALFDDFDASPLLTRHSIENMVRINNATNGHYGRGWEVFEENGQMVYGHSGSLPGTLTQTRWAPPGIAQAAFINTRKAMAGFELENPTTTPAHDLFESVGIVGERLGAALAESWIPVVANGAGAGGSLWRSDVGLLNRSIITNQVKVRVEMPGLAVDRDLELAPGEHLVVRDIVSELGLSGSGSLRVFSFEPLTVASRTYNSSDEGTFGQYLGGVTGPGGLSNGDSAVLMHLLEDDAARSNIGILNAGRRQARVQIVLYDGAGTEVGRANRTVDPRRIKQLNRPFETIGGRTDIDPGYAVITVLDGEEIVVYGSVVDAGTNDPTTIPMKHGAGATLVHIAAAARGEGAEGSVWRTDLGLLNPGAQTVEASLSFHPPGGPDLAMSVTLAPGEHRLLDDIVGRLGGEGSGSLEISSSGPVLVSSRTYNQGLEGSFGQYLDGFDIEDTAGEDQQVWLPQLQQNPEFRTNIGLFNISEERARVKVDLHDAGGLLLSTTERSIAAGDRVQLQEPYDRIAGRNDITSGYAVVEVVAGSGVSAYASVIDNRTNDPTTVPMAR